MAKEKYIEQLIRFEKRNSTEDPHFRALKNALKKYYGLDWDKIKHKYL